MLGALADNSVFGVELGPWGPWLLVLGALVVATLALGIIVFLVGRIDYRITERHLQVTLLGIPIRRLRLDNVRHISSHRPPVSERWPNQIFIRRDRVLVIEKRRGLFRHFLITPEQRYTFKAALDRAVRAVNGLPPAPTVADRMAFGVMMAAQTGLSAIEQGTGVPPPVATPPPPKPTEAGA